MIFSEAKAFSLTFQDEFKTYDKLDSYTKEIFIISSIDDYLFRSYDISILFYWHYNQRLFLLNYQDY